MGKTLGKEILRRDRQGCPVVRCVHVKYILVHNLKLQLLIQVDRRRLHNLLPRQKSVRTHQTHKHEHLPQAVMFVDTRFPPFDCMMVISRTILQESETNQCPRETRRQAMVVLEQIDISRYISLLIVSLSKRMPDDDLDFEGDSEFRWRQLSV